MNPGYIYRAGQPVDIVNADRPGDPSLNDEITKAFCQMLRDVLLGGLTCTAPLTFRVTPRPSSLDALGSYSGSAILYR